MRVASHPVRALAISTMILLLSTTAASAELKIGVLTLHGVGSQQKGTDFDQPLRAALEKAAETGTQVIVRTVYYHGKKQSRQTSLWEQFDKLEDENPAALDQKIARRLMFATIGDALAYTNNSSNRNSYYCSSHHSVRQAIESLQKELGEESVVVVVAHSLGCKVIFDYLCDVQTGQGIWSQDRQPSDEQKLSNLRILISTGCNLPLFESTTTKAEQRFFRFHHEFEWLNFYDRDDLLGWPLRPLGGKFEEVVNDQERNGVGSVLTSHTKYWKDKSLNAEIARRILQLATVVPKSD